MSLISVFSDCCKDQKKKQEAEDGAIEATKDLTVAEDVEVVVEDKEIIVDNAAVDEVADDQEKKIITFHLVRHGETNYNQKGRVQGHMDISLNENGFNQANSLGLCLSKYLKNANAVIASPVLRAKQTGMFIVFSIFVCNSALFG